MIPPDVGAVSAEIDEKEAPAPVGDSKNRSPRGPGVFVEIEDDPGLTKVVSAAGSAKGSSKRIVRAEGSAKGGGSKKDAGSNSDGGDLPQIDWDESNADSHSADHRGEASEHVQVSRRADENIELSDEDENPGVTGDEYRLPPSDLLDATPPSIRKVDEGVLQENAKVLEQKLLEPEDRRTGCRSSSRSGHHHV